MHRSSPRRTCFDPIRVGFAMWQFILRLKRFRGEEKQRNRESEKRYFEVGHGLKLEGQICSKDLSVL